MARVSTIGTGTTGSALRHARELEVLGFLQITSAAARRIAWTGGFTVS